MEDRGSHTAEFTHSDFTVGWLCALPKEQTAATAMLDQKHPELPKPHNDPNTYTLGSIGKHNIVIACLPKGKIGTNVAAAYATQMMRTFPSIKVGLMVGIGGGIPPKVRLGDVVVSTPTGQYPGVVQWDFGKAEKAGEFKRTGALNNPPSALLTALTKLETNYEMAGSKIPEYLDEMAKKWPRLVRKYIWSDSLKDPMYESDTSDRDPGDPHVHYGLIASGNQVIKDAKFRDRLNESLGGDVLCFEMEAAGLLDFPCIVIRGICDYADLHKNEDWQEHAAAVAAAFAKELLQYVQPSDVEGTRPVKDVLEDLLKQVQQDTSATREDVAHIKSELVKEQDLEILNWLTSVDYGPVQSDYLSRRQPGTGQWLLESIEFQDWLAISNRTLFCPGIPGAGKTIITSIVVDDLSSRFDIDSNIGMAYIYCNFQRQNKQSIDYLLASVLKQLTPPHSSQLDNVKSVYDRHKKKRTRPSLEEIVQLLDSVVGIYSRVFIIVDALDECQVSDGCRLKFLSALFELQIRHRINIFATSRFIPEVTEHFKDSKTLVIYAKTDDVAKYLKDHMHELPYFVQQNQQLQQEIVTGILSVIDGMFLLSSIYLGVLKESLTLNEIRSTMKLFPTQGQARHDDGRKAKILDRAYKQAIDRIQGQTVGRKKLAFKALSWVTNAKRQLTTSELVHALATKRGSSELDNGDLVHIDDIISVCAGLIVVDTESRIIRLIHYTTQEYLKRTQKQWCPSAESRITKTCITYLSFAIFKDGACKTDDRFKERLQLNPFYDYAAQNWGHHARDNDDATLNQHIVTFLKSKTSLQASIQALMVNKLRESEKHYSQRTPKGMTGLHLAGYFGLFDATYTLLRDGYSPDLMDSFPRTPLVYAAKNGHGDVVRLMLAIEADANSLAKSRQPALRAAVDGGHLWIVEDLVAAGANVNTTHRGNQTMLQAAAGKGRLELVEKLLAAGADVNAITTAEAGRTALQSAVVGGQLAVVEKLLDAGANVNTDTGGRYLPLQTAARRGHLAIVERLLEAKADVNVITGREGRTALQAAAMGNHLGIVERLLAAGADANTAANSYPTALQIAAAKGYLEVVEQLLEAGADVNAPAEAWWTALQAAAENGIPEVVEKLLAAGAHVNAAGNDDHTALHVAIFGGHLTVVKKLLAVGAEVNTSCRHGQTPLQAAAERGNLEIVKKLLEAGADVDAAGYAGRTAFQTAAEEGNVAVMKELLAAGAEIHSVTAVATDTGRTVLQSAAKGGQLEVVEQLLEAGADVNAAAAKAGWTALQAAAGSGHPAIVEKLLAVGADIDAAAPDYAGRTALQAAAGEGHLSIVEQLLAARADVNAVAAHFSGWTALQAAAEKGHLEIMERLLEAGANVNAAGAAVRGQTALQAAAGGGHLEVVEKLLAAGAEANAPPDEAAWTALQAAAYGGHLEVVEKLLAAGANVNAAPAKAGWTALQAASRRGHRDVVQKLLTAGALT